MPEREAVSREEVHEALEALYDNVALLRSGFGERFSDIGAAEGLGDRAVRPRAVLLEAIEMLRPVRRAAFGSRDSRACDVLTLRYVERLGTPEIMEELSIGRRQVFRDLSQAEEKLAQILGRWAEGDPLASDLDQAADPIRSELTMLASRPMEIGLSAVISEAVEMVRPLAAERGVTFTGSWPADGDQVVADRSLLKQILVQLFSLAVQYCRGSDVTLSIAAQEAGLGLVVLFRPREGGYLDRVADLQRIAQHQGITIQARDCQSACEVRLSLRRQEPRLVMVVEDNPGAVELYRRYLSGNSWRVRHVADPRVAFELARREEPDVIVLDVMMPGMDGWSVLQALKQRPETNAIPVLLCSIVEDRELSRILGATVSLKKPVAQGDFIAALHRCLRREEPGL